MAKRVGLARTLVTQPDIILYDEPTTGLDPVTTHAIHELIKELQHSLGVTSIVVSHDPEILPYADHVALLDNGIISHEGPPHTLVHCSHPLAQQFMALQRPVAHRYAPFSLTT
jgi:phospholipid/cholesterol/gamma-HCH transport system ATP-binding protein